MLSRVVTENKNGSNVVTSRTRVDYDYTSTGIRSLSVDWNDANLNNSFATSERTGSVEYLVDSTNHTGYAHTIVETTKNAAGVATKRIVYTYGSDEISQTTYLPPSGGGAGWNAGTTLTFSHDAHTSVRMLTDAAGAIAQVFTYAAYGELIASHNRIAQSVGTVGAQGLQSQALTSLLYNGEAFDSRIGKLYLRARWYDGHRFTTLDPFFGNGSDPLSFNKYGFVHANPVMGIDPTGMFGVLGGSIGSMTIGQRLNTMQMPTFARAYLITTNFIGRTAGPLLYDWAKNFVINAIFPTGSRFVLSWWSSRFAESFLHVGMTFAMRAAFSGVMGVVSNSYIGAYSSEVSHALRRISRTGAGLNGFLAMSGPLIAEEAEDYSDQLEAIANGVMNGNLFVKPFREGQLGALGNAVLVYQTATAMTAAVQKKVNAIESIVLRFYNALPPGLQRQIDAELGLNEPLKTIDFNLNSTELLPNIALGTLNPGNDLNVLNAAILAADSGNTRSTAIELKTLFRRLEGKYGDVSINGRKFNQ